MICKNNGPDKQKMAQEEKRSSTKPVVDRIWSIGSVNLYVRKNGPDGRKPGPDSANSGPMGHFLEPFFELKC